MLRKTFFHIPGIGKTTEKALWDQGCDDWQVLLDGLDQYSVGSANREITKITLEESISALGRGEHQFFVPFLGLAEAWRAFPEFRSSCVYLDIETDGGQSGDSVTMVGLFDGKEFTALIRDDNLGEFPDIISHYSMIVTFYGSGFDLPMLQKRFPSVRMDQIHLDLCPTLRKVGFRGGLKSIEKQLGIARPEQADGLSGMDAIRLWREYQRGDDESLETLIAYNREDVVNLERLAEIAYERLSASV